MELWLLLCHLLVHLLHLNRVEIIFYMSIPPVIYAAFIDIRTFLVHWHLNQDNVGPPEKSSSSLRWHQKNPQKNHKKWKNHLQSVQSVAGKSIDKEIYLTGS